MIRRAARALFAPGIALVACLVVGCSEPEPASSSSSDVDCSIPSENADVLSLMKDVYLWYQDVPSVDSGAYSSPEEILDALIYKKIDRWSYLTKKTKDSAYYNDGVLVGIGIRMRHDVDNAVRLGLVYEGSPAGDAGLMRGDKIVAVAGKTTAAIDEGNLWDAVLGPDEDGVSVSMTVEPAAGGSARDLTLTKKPFTIKTTPIREVLSDNGRSIGYLYLDRFIGPSADELIDAFQSFKNAGIDDLIVDLRYNGGGLIDVAQILGSLIGGYRTAGKTFSRLIHNDKHPGWDTSQIFEDHDESLDLPRVFIITTSSTASASELLINGLSPFLDVILIGGVTYGKPVGMNAYPICDLVAHPISFRMLNADGHGDFYDGIKPSCFAGDDLLRPLGDASEASIAEALSFIRTGSCSISPKPRVSMASAPGQASARVSSRPLPTRGFRSEIDAF